MTTQSKKTKLAVIAGAIVFVFLSLMVYALRRNPLNIPSQLVNRTAPTFSSQVAQGGSFDLSQHTGKGQWVIVNFWSTTCVVCRYEAPELERFYQTTRTQGTNAPLFVSVNIQEDVSSVLSYQRDHQLSFPVILDSNGKISLDYGVTGTPETFFIDPQGIVRHRVAGEVDNDSIYRFMDWLEKNPNKSPEDASRDFANMRNGTEG